MDVDGRIVGLERRIDELESRLQMFSGIIAALQPVSRLLVKYGVTEPQQMEVYRLINEMASRLDRGEMPSFTEFDDRVTAIIGASHSDRAFVALLVEALKIERPDSMRLYNHFSRAMDLLRV
jgi:hypothetical protein